MRTQYKLLLLLGIYVGASQMYKENTVQLAITKAKSLGGRILNVGAVGIGNIISKTATVKEWNECDISPADGMDYCDIAARMPYKDKEYDVVFASHVIEHVKPQEVIHAINEFQRIGRKVIIVIPPSFMLAFYLAQGHQSQIRKIGNSLNIRNNPIYNSVYENYTIKINSDAVEIYQ